MLRRNRRWLMAAAVLTAAALPGCRNGDTSDQTQPAGAPAQQAAGETSKTADVSPPPEPPPPPTIPEVHLLEADRQTCVLWVGDVMPDAELPDPAGQLHSLSGLLGEKLTVVFFWTIGSSEFSAMAARTALEDLQKDVFEPYGQKGLQVICVNVGDAPELIKPAVDAASAAFPILLDSDGALFARMAKERLPRPYLLDAEGKILWFDLEFSRTSRDKLTQGIQVALGEIGRQ